MSLQRTSTRKRRNKFVRSKTKIEFYYQIQLNLIEKLFYLLIFVC
jgi:hypothetical protein